jgi:hypothetical protein
MVTASSKKRPAQGEDPIAKKNSNSSASVLSVSGASGDVEVDPQVHAGSAVVSPEKSTIKACSHYLLNTASHKFEKYDSLLMAEKLRAMLVKHAPQLEKCLVIQEFPSDIDAQQYLDCLVRLGGGDGMPDDEAPDARGDDSKLPGTQVYPRPPSSFRAGELFDDPIDDDDVPFETVDGETGTQATVVVASSSKRMSAFDAAIIGHGASITVLRWRLPDSPWHVYAWKLMDGAEQYWSHKPQMWMHAVATEKEVPIFAAPATLTIHKAMNRCNAAPIRGVPCGPSTILTIKTKRSGKVIDQYLLYGLVKNTKSNEEVAKNLKNFSDQCGKHFVIREAYHKCVALRMQNNYISDDTKPDGGKYWIKFATAANNINVREMKYLSEVFLDQDITNITNLAYGTKGLAPSMWKPEIRNAAFGPVQG